MRAEPARTAAEIWAHLDVRYRFGYTREGSVLPPALQEEPLRELVRGLVEGGALRDLAASGVLGNLGPLLRPVAGAGDVVAGMLPKMSVGEVRSPH